ncbi:hypothetical protein ABC347_00175 [Sphingomonas sp. 1P06PA]|uniref:glycine-rich domain-containing protein n=1 Tax=Sphingomonas sp. 1P06PA TaxID=554121 RepID=UPI0039A4A78B
MRGAGCGPDDPLWTALSAMRIEPAGAALSFADRLAAENGWSRTEAAAVLEEYRRFLYLAATTSDAVTPSDAVDQAWHLHLAYSRHYWEQLCGVIIGQPLHHGPTAGGTAAASRYRDQYRATLAAYRAAFGAEPPAAIWPPVGRRFAVRARRIDLDRSIVLPRGPALAVIAALPLAACASIAGGWPILLLPTGIILAIAIVLRSEKRRRRRAGGDGDGGCGGGVDSDDGDGGSGDGGCGGGCGGD